MVFNIKNREIPIVHRILKVHEQEDGTVSVLTKGDNNQVHDRGLYSDGPMWLQREDIVQGCELREQGRSALCDSRCGSGSPVGR